MAERLDGTVTREHEFLGSFARGKWVETPWKRLDLSEVISFGLEGAGIRIGFLVSDGILGLNGQPLELALQSREGWLFPITGREDVMYRPLPPVKDAASELTMRGSTHKRELRERLRRFGALAARQQLLGYHVGWMVKGRDEKTGPYTLRLEAVVPAEDGEPITAHLGVLMEKGFSGVLRIRRRGLEFPRVNTIVRPGVANKIALHLEVI